MTIQEIKSIAPAIFTTSADPKMSKKYWKKNRWINVDAQSNVDGWMTFMHAGR
jgi:hypothetical protein